MKIQETAYNSELYNLSKQLRTAAAIPGEQAIKQITLFDEILLAMGDCQGGEAQLSP